MDFLFLHLSSLLCVMTLFSPSLSLADTETRFNCPRALLESRKLTYRYDDVKKMINVHGRLALDLRSLDLLQAEHSYKESIKDSPWYRTKRVFEEIPEIKVHNDFPSEVALITYEGLRNALNLVGLSDGTAASLTWIRRITRAYDKETRHLAMVHARRKLRLNESGVAIKFYGITVNSARDAFGLVHELVSGGPFVTPKNAVELDKVDAVLTSLEQAELTDVVHYDQYDGIRSIERVGSNLEKLDLISLWRTLDHRVLMDDVGVSYAQPGPENFRSIPPAPPNSAAGWFTFQRGLYLLRMDADEGIRYLENLRSQDRDQTKPISGAYMGLINFFNALLEKDIEAVYPYRDYLRSLRPL